MSKTALPQWFFFLQTTAAQGNRTMMKSIPIKHHYHHISVKRFQQKHVTCKVSFEAKSLLRV